VLAKADPNPASMMANETMPDVLEIQQYLQRNPQNHPNPSTGQIELWQGSIMNAPNWSIMTCINSTHGTI
jgi:hypothetical protein